MVFRSAVYVISLAWVMIVSSEPAAADCKQPKLESFLEDSRAVLKFTGPYYPSPVPYDLGFKVGAQAFQWFGVAWEAPKDGALFVLDCAGNRLAATRLGHVLALRHGPVLPRIGSTVEVSYIAQTGTGYERQSADIFAFLNNSLKSLWTHTLYERVSILPLEEQTLEDYQWTLSGDGRQIRVGGYRTVYPKTERLDDPGGPPTKHKISPETFCWDVTHIRYVLCSGSR